MSAVAIECPVCATPISTADAFCGGCGNEVEASWGPATPVGPVGSRVCPACNAPLDALDTFCGSCGSAAPRPRSSATAFKRPAAPAAAAIPTATPAAATIQRSPTSSPGAAPAPKAKPTVAVRSSKNASVIVAVASAVAVVAVSVVVLVLLAGSPAQQVDSATPTTSQASATSAPAPPASAPTSQPPDGGSSGPPGVPTAPGSESSREDEGYQRRSGDGSGSAGSAYFWSVIVDSKRDRSEAEAIARRLSSMGESAQVDRSSDYASLNPGYWVVHVGTYSDERSAYRAQQQLQVNLGSARFADVYRRCFGDKPPCRDNDPHISG